MSKIQIENLRSIFNETINQFNYSSNLYDSLESKANSLIVSISIILVIAINSYFLKILTEKSVYFNLFYYNGVIFIVFSFIHLLRIRKIKFEKINLESLQKTFIKNPNKNFTKIIIGEYIPIIKENLKNYYRKDSELRIINVTIKIGLSILIIGIIYILWGINFL